MKSHNEKEKIMDIGARVRRARLAKDMTQKALAEACGLGHITINRIEKGVVTKVYPETLKALAQTLEISADYLLGLENNMRDTPSRKGRRAEGG